MTVRLLDGTLASVEVCICGRSHVCVQDGVKALVQTAFPGGSGPALPISCPSQCQLETPAALLHSVGVAEIHVGEATEECSRPARLLKTSQDNEAQGRTKKQKTS